MGVNTLTDENLAIWAEFFVIMSDYIIEDNNNGGYIK